MDRTQRTRKALKPGKMYRYQPPKSSIWGHRLRNFGAALPMVCQVIHRQHTTQSWQVRCLLRSRPVEDCWLIYGLLCKILSIIQRTAVAMARWFNLLRCFSPVP